MFAPMENNTWKSQYWENSVAHLGATGWLDQYNTVLVSHTDGPLHDILYLQVGDDVLVWDANTIRLYKVVSIQIVSKYAVEVIDQFNGSALTLMVCYGDDYRYVVRAE